MEYSFNENRGLSRTGLLVTLCVIAFLLFYLYLALSSNDVREAADRVVCSTNLKGLGTAMAVYAEDYDSRFPQLPGKGPWSKELGFDYDLKDPDFKGEQSNTGRTISASWYLLVREADVSPKSFVCPSSKEKAFDGENSNGLDIIQLWDFGDNPYKHVSYVMHKPYGAYPAYLELSAAFAVAADMNPWMKMGDFVSTPNEKNYRQIINAKGKETDKYGNSFNHPQYDRDRMPWNRYIKGTAAGQNVLFGDGHTSYGRTSQRRTSNSYEEQPNCGVNDDNIYTYWSTDKNPTEQDIQGGTPPTARNKENDAKSREDSFLVL